MRSFHNEFEINVCLVCERPIERTIFVSTFHHRDRDKRTLIQDNFEAKKKKSIFLMLCGFSGIWFHGFYDLFCCSKQIHRGRWTSDSMRLENYFLLNLISDFRGTHNIRGWISIWENHISSLLIVANLLRIHVKWNKRTLGVPFVPLYVRAFHSHDHRCHRLKCSNNNRNR